jgi:hypothetical protein
MRLTNGESDSAHNHSASPDFAPEAGPSAAMNGHTSNGHARANNGATNNARTSTPGSLKVHGRVVQKVELPGLTLYDDSYVDREEFVRLVIQSLRDVGYMCVVLNLLPG